MGQMGTEGCERGWNEGDKGKGRGKKRGQIGKGGGKAWTPMTFGHGHL